LDPQLRIIPEEKEVISNPDIGPFTTYCKKSTQIYKFELEEQMRKFTVLNLVLLLSLILGACAKSTPVVETVVIKETQVVVEKQTQVVNVTQIVKETQVVKETEVVNVVITATPVPVPTEIPATTAPLTEAEKWAQANGLGPYQPATDDWAAIEAAAKIEGSVMVYANSSKFEKLLDAWNALYPDIKLEGGDTDGISTKMRAEQEAGNVVGDVWFNSDGHLLYGEFVPNQWLWSFVPRDVVIPEVTAARPFAISRHSVDVWGYNQEVHPEGCPLTNWWQLVEPALAGKAFMEDPLSDPSTTAKITLVVEHADEMAAAYLEYYGREWTTDEAAGPDAFGTSPENAGYLWLRKLAWNHPGIQPGGDEVDEAFASLGMDKTVEPGYGFTGYSSYQNTLDGELAMAPCLNLKPVIGILKANYLAIANNAPHPNAAKLFIRFALSQDGFKPWQQMGTYPAAEGLSPVEGMPPQADLKVWPSDDLFAWENNSKVRDFWAVNLLAAP
jgi:iron(III) transport system substrate-binding protein